MCRAAHTLLTGSWENSSNVEVLQSFGMRGETHTRCWLFFLLCMAPRLFAGPVQASPAQFQTIRIPRVSTPPKLEEFLNMEPPPNWRDKLAKVDRFIQRIPSDGAPASQRTEAYLGYDDKNQWYIVRNSWGKSWGMKGYFTLPYAYLADSNLCDDFWTIRRGEGM